MNEKSGSKARVERPPRQDQFDVYMMSNNTVGNERGGEALSDRSHGNADNNTIMQQINNFSLTPMNDALAETTINDHKYLLEQVENKCAIAFFAVVNRNQSLYNALHRFAMNEIADDEEEEGRP